MTHARPDKALPIDSASLDASRLFTWQTITLSTLFIGYTGYYVCRSNFAVTVPLLEAAAPGGITKADLGTIASVGIACYAAGKYANGLLAEWFGGKTLFVFGMFASALCTVAFGMSSGLVLFLAIWGLNRFVQSMGWVALVKLASRWFPFRLQATVMGLLSMSYLLGDAASRAYLGTCIKLGADWRMVFFIAAGTLGVLAVGALFALRSSPRDVGLAEPAANPENVYGEPHETERAATLREILPPLLVSPAFWLACFMNFGLTLIRETFNFWTPTYLKEVGELSAGNAAITSLLFPLTGALSALMGGVVVDWCGGKHGRVMLPALLVMIGILVLLGLTPAQGQPVLAMTLVCGVSFFLIAPYTFLSGAIPLSFGGKKGSAAAAGIIDGVGYMGAILSGAGIALIAQRFGWSGAFLSLAGIAVLTTLAAVGYMLNQEARPVGIIRDTEQKSRDMRN